MTINEILNNSSIEHTISPSPLSIIIAEYDADYLYDACILIIFLIEQGYFLKHQSERKTVWSCSLSSI